MVEKMVHILAERADGNVITAFHFMGDDQARLDAYIAKQRADGYTVTITGEDVKWRPKPVRETVYDAEIAPLMAQIIATCKKNDIPILAYFQLDDRTEDTDLMVCRTVILPSNTSTKLHRAAAAIR